MNAKFILIVCGIITGAIASIEIEDFTENKGVAPIVLGNARMLEGTTQFLHVINTSTYLPIADQNNNNLITIQKKIADQNNTKIVKTFTQRIRTLTKESITLIKTIEMLTPKTRKTRGIHIIFGNVIEADMNQINAALKQVNTNENLLIGKINEQIEINKGMINRFREVENYINGEVKTLTENLNLVNRKLDEIDFILITEQNLHGIEYVIRNLQQHVDEILDSISLAKQGYISHYLLTKEESNFVYENLESQGIPIESEHELFQFLNIKAYYKNPMVVFSIIIPKYSNITFKNIKIFPLTINNTYTIQIPSKFIHIHEKIARYSDESCNKIDDMYFCNENEVYTTQDNCVSKIITNEPTTCDLTEGNIQTYIQQFQQEFIIINQQTPPEFKTDCNHQLNKFLPTQCIVKIRNCTITINNVTYTSKSKKFINTYSYIPYNEIKVKNKTKELSQNKLSELTLNNMDKLSYVQQHTIPQNQHYSTWGITTIIIIGIIGYLCILRYCPTCTPCQWYKKIRESPDIKSMLTSNNFVEDNKNLSPGELRQQPTSVRLFPTLNSVDTA